MREQDLPERWRSRVVEHALKTSDGKYRSLGIGAFGRQHIELVFPDGSRVFFRYAFTLEDPGAGELGVFTEHCGYHVFPLTDTEVSVYHD